MRLNQPSSDVIDKRRSRLVMILAGLSALIGSVVGFHSCPGTEPDPEANLVSLTSTTLEDVQVFWDHTLPGYHHAKLVLYRGAVGTACGRGLYNDGPFYCAKDERVYLDLHFLEHIRGEFARAYVIAHELGHHVEHLNHQPVVGQPAELEADCLAGAWAADAQRRNVASNDEVEAALTAVTDAGDDALRPGSSPESWSHGSSAERVAAVRRGLGGGVAACTSP